MASAAALRAPLSLRPLPRPLGLGIARPLAPPESDFDAIVQRLVPPSDQNHQRQTAFRLYRNGDRCILRFDFSDVRTATAIRVAHKILTNTSGYAWSPNGLHFRSFPLWPTFTQTVDDEIAMYEERQTRALGPISSMVAMYVRGGRLTLRGHGGNIWTYVGSSDEEIRALFHKMLSYRVRIQPDIFALAPETTACYKLEDRALRDMIPGVDTPIYFVKQYLLLWDQSSKAALYDEATRIRGLRVAQNPQVNAAAAGSMVFAAGQSIDSVDIGRAEYVRHGKQKTMRCIPLNDDVDLAKEGFALHNWEHHCTSPSCVTKEDLAVTMGNLDQLERNPDHQTEDGKKMVAAVGTIYRHVLEYLYTEAYPQDLRVLANRKILRGEHKE